MTHLHHTGTLLHRLFTGSISTLLLLLSLSSQADIIVTEDFSSGSVPATWTNTALQGTDVWYVRNAPIFSSPSGGFYVVFDDNLLGAATFPNEAVLQTPVMDCSGRTSLKIEYTHHWFGVENTHGYVEISNDGGTTWDTIIDYHKTTRGSLAAPQDTILDITAWAANQPDVRVRFHYTDGGQAGMYWLIDDVTVFADPDVGATDLIVPDHLGCFVAYGTTESISVEVTNHGVNPVSNIPVSCTITGGTSITLSGTITGPLAAGAKDTIQLTGTADLSADTTYIFTVYTTLGTDEYVNNDTFVDTRHQLVVTYPFTEDFNPHDGGWWEDGQNPPDNNGRNFVWGALPYLNGAQGEGNSWYVETTVSNKGDYIWLNSPPFDFTSLTNPQVIMDLKYSLHNSDFFQVQYTTDGTTWVQLGTSADPNWYNTTNHWRNNTGSPVNTWTTYQHNLCNLAGESCVKFRFYGRPYYSSPTYSGYHEFGLDNFIVMDGNDVGVSLYLEPVNDGCLYSTNQQVRVRVFNNSCAPVTNVPIQCDITNALTTSLIDTVPGPIPVGSYVDFTFATTFDMTGTGTYDFSTYTKSPIDFNTSNDTLTTSITVNQIVISTFPYSEDFNASDGYWLPGGSAPPTNNNRNFVRGNLPYLGGPQLQGNSWYVDATQSNQGAYIWVESPVFDFTNVTGPVLGMDIQYSLHNSDFFQVQYSTNGGTTWAQLGTGTDPNWYNTTSHWRNNYTTPVNSWTHVESDLCFLSGNPCVKFRVYGRPYYSTPTYANYHLFAFDNFTIDGGTGDDVEPLEIILSDGGACAGFSTTETISVVVANNTCRPITNVPINLHLNGGGAISEIMPGPIPAFDNAIYTFTATLDLSAAGTHDIAVVTKYATDTIPSNDSLSQNRFNNIAIAAYPYIEDFNADNGGWVSRTTVGHRLFRHDTLTYLNGPQGEGRSWFVETTQSNKGEYIWVESPIFDFSSLTDPQLTMDVKYGLHNSDFFSVQYSTNGGTSWTQLGNGSDPRWYNSTNDWRNNYLSPVSQWTQVQHSLCNLAGQSCVQFRIYGRPYYSTPLYGGYHRFAMDNFAIKDGPDVGIVAYVEPVDVGCLFSTGQQVTVEVYNWTCSPVSNVPITCEVTGQAITTLTGTVPGPIPAEGSVNYTFPTTFNMAGTGTYNFESYTDYAPDINPVNDTLNTSILVVQTKVSTFPYVQDFNSGNAYWFASGTNPPANNNRNFVLGTVPYLGGPQGQGDSWYVETTQTNVGDYIWVESPVFDFSNLTNPKLSFDIMHSLHNSDFFQVQYSLNGGTSWTQLGSGSDPNWYNTTSHWRNSYAAPVNVWTNVEQELCILSGESCVKFRIYGRPYYSDPTYPTYYNFAFDNFQIDNGAGDDIQPLEVILSDAGDCSAFSTTETISVLIANNTCRPLYNVPVDLQIDGGAVISEVMPGPIPRFNNYIYTFTAKGDLSGTGTHTISVTTNLATDTLAANDNLQQIRYSNAPINTYPYVEDFETNNGGWVSRTTVYHRYFHHDTLNYLNGAQGEGRSWFCETTLSNNGTWIYLEGPVFDLTGMSNPQLSFDLKHSLHNSDYFRVEYSINGGTTWTQLGSGSDPNWYTTANYWQNTYAAPVNAWTNHQHSLCDVVGQTCVKLRFSGRPYYSSPTYSNYHMFAVDNITIEDGEDVGVTAYIEPYDDGCLFSDTQQVTITVFNLGCGPISNVPVECTISGPVNTTLTGTVPGPIAAGGTANYTFPTTFDMTGIGTFDFVAYTQSPIDLNRANDTLTLSIDVAQIRVDSFPYWQDFEFGAAYWIDTGNTPPNNQNRNFVLGSLPYLNGPEGHGDSWYVETTQSNQGAYIWVESPVYDFTNVNNPKLLMDIKYSLHNSDFFQVQYSIDGGSSWTQLGSGSNPYWYNTASHWRNNTGSPVDSWTNVEMPLCALVGESCVKFRMYGRPYYSSPTYTGYHNFAFDNVHVTNTPIDAEVLLVQGCFGSEYPLEVSLFNNDRLCVVSPDINSIDISYTVDGGPVKTINVTGLSIPFGGADIIEIDSVTIPTDSSVIKVWCSNPNGLEDQIFENDTIYGYGSTYPNCNDHCSNAQQLGYGTTTATQNTNATIDPAEDPSFNGCGFPTLENTVWYFFETDSTGGDVTVFFHDITCQPASNGIQVSIDRLTGTPCDTAGYVNEYCANNGNVLDFQWGPINLPPLTTYYITVDGFAGNDCDFSITILGAVFILPIELETYEVNCAGRDNVITWTTSSEHGSDNFVVERSYDGRHFEPIRTINAAGFSSYAQDYQFVDKDARWGVPVYYRLKLNSLNGEEDYSKIQVVKCNDRGMGIQVQPNPAMFDLLVKIPSFETQNATIRMLDVVGQTVLFHAVSLSEGDNNVQIVLDDLAAGAYFVEVEAGGERFVEKVVVVRD